MATPWNTRNFKQEASAGHRAMHVQLYPLGLFGSQRIACLPGTHPLISLSQYDELA